MGGAAQLGILLGIAGDNLDDVLGAGGNAGAAGHALVQIHFGNAVHNVDGVKLTGVHAVAAAQAAIGALQGAGGHAGNCQTAGQAHIVIAGLVVAAAGTHNLCHLGCALFHGDAHDFTDLLGQRSAAGGAGVDGSQTLYHGVGVTAAAGVAAAAAVGAGQDLSNGFFTGVLLHSEDLGSDGQNDTEDDAQNRQYDRG